MSGTPPYCVRILGGQKVSPKNLNLDGSDDQFYRYKVRQMFAQVTGKGKMVKTNFLNIDDVAKDLRVPPTYLCAFFGYALVAKSAYEGKRPERERGSVSGDYTAARLSEVMFQMIKEFILCPKCNLPELSYTVDAKEEKVGMECRGCGTPSTADRISPKFKKFVLQHPPTGGAAFGEKASAAKKKSAVAKKLASVAEAADAAKSGDAAAAGGAAKGRRKKAAADDDEDDVEWSVSVDADEVKARRKALLPQAATAVFDGRTKKSLSLAEVTAAAVEFADESDSTTLVAAAKALECDDRTRMAALVAALFDTSRELKPQLVRRQPVFAALCVNDRICQQALLNALEPWAADDALGKKIPLVLKEYYDTDVLDEEHIISWHDTPSSTDAGNKLRAITAPMVKWLQEADDDDDDEE